MGEKPDVIYGRLLESVHITGYTMERACIGLEYLLEDNRWKAVGVGFDDIHKFADSINLSQFKIAVDRRKKLAERFAELETSQRATARALGVSVETIRRDLGRVTSMTKEEESTRQVVTDVTPRSLSIKGDEAAQFVERKPQSIVTYFTGLNENFTPQEIIEKVRTVLGKIELDPASCDFAQKTVKAVKYYTEETDSLRPEIKWTGKIFLNPPYSTGLIDRFIEKLILSDYEEAILLTNNNTDTRWFHAAAKASKIICFTSGRLAFYTKEKLRTQPTNGQALFYFGENVELFFETFSDIGLLVHVV